MQRKGSVCAKMSDQYRSAVVYVRSRYIADTPEERKENISISVALKELAYSRGARLAISPIEHANWEKGETQEERMRELRKCLTIIDGLKFSGSKVLFLSPRHQKESDGMLIERLMNPEIEIVYDS